MAEKTLNVKIISRHDTEAAWIEADPVLLEGEVAYSTDKNNRYKVGDGTSKWSALAYSKADPMTHTHTKSQISDFPTSLKNPSALTIQFNGTTNKTYDGSSAQTVNITPGGIGAATSGHTHSNATTSAAGFLRQLDGSTAHYLRGDGSWATPPNTTYSTMKGATSSAAGSSGLVPAPAAGKQTFFLRGDGTWVVPTNTNTTYTLTKSGSTITLTGSDGKTTSVTDSNTTYSLSSFGITATAAELNKLDGVITTATELNYVHGVTSAIQTQLNGKASTSHTHNYAGSSSAGGAATSAVKLATARTINDVSFNGTANIKLSSMYSEDLNGKTVSLNSYNLSSGTPKIKYYCCATDGGGANITGRPSDSIKQAFTLKCESIRWASTTDYITKQTYIQGSTNITWERYCVSGTWSSWGEVYTSNNKPTASEIGAATSSHTHNYAGSSSAGGAATSANKLNTNAGSATQPVYFSGGVPVKCTYTLGKSVPSNAVFTDTNTTNTAGSTNTSSKIFLVGATSQTSAPVTYSHDTVYVGTDGCIYSSGLRVATEVYQSSEPTAQVVNDIWMQAY